jgi:hypothetical protein
MTYAELEIQLHPFISAFFEGTWSALAILPPGKEHPVPIGE